MTVRHESKQKYQDAQGMTEMTLSYFLQLIHVVQVVHGCGSVSWPTFGFGRVSLSSKLKSKSLWNRKLYLGELSVVYMLV